MTASGQLSRPPAGTFVTAYGQSLVSVVISVGRKLDTGAPLTGTDEHDPADFTAMNEVGLPVIPAESHIARAHSRNRSETILRRPYNYDDTPQAT